MPAASSFDYDTAAAHYDQHRRGIGPYFDPLVELACATAPKQVLEIGPGTGNISLPMREALNVPFLGVDASRNMLRKARAKQAGLNLVQGDACRLPLADSSADFAYAVLVIQHIRDLPAFYAECRRVVRDTVAFVTASHEFIRRHPMTAFFPSFAAVDTARFPAIDTIEYGLRNAGFTTTARIETRAAPLPIDAAYVQKVRARFISTYDLLPADEFNEGIERLEREIATHGQLAEPMVWEATIVHARA